MEVEMWWVLGEGKLYDGRVVNEELLRAGLAWVFVKYCKVDRYYNIEADAGKRRVGLWVDREPVAPWEWRRRN